MGNDELKTERSRVRRNHKIAHYDRREVYDVLDAGFIAHIGYMGKFGIGVTPTCYWREGNYVYWHGSSASGTMRGAAAKDVCVTVTHFDGLVLASSALHHSANYRTAMIFGTPELVTDPVEKARTLAHFIDHLVPGRWQTLRPMTNQELKATAILRLEIKEASVKIRSGNAVDDPEDVPLPIWGGVIPVSETFGKATPDPLKPADLPVPSAVKGYDGRTFSEVIVQRKVKR